MAETILAGKQIKKFSCNQCFALHAFVGAKGTGFLKYLFMSNCPGYTSYRHRKKKEPYYLQMDCHK
jgi:hypothetical protein